MNNPIEIFDGRAIPCSVSQFDFRPGCHVTQGPAEHDLPMLPSYTNEQGQLIGVEV